MLRGVIKRVFGNHRGVTHGFIRQGNGQDIFFSFNDVAENSKQYICDNLKVEFNVANGNDGRPKATNVSILKSNYEFLNPYNFVRFLPVPSSSPSNKEQPVTIEQNKQTAEQKHKNTALDKKNVIVSNSNAMVLAFAKANIDKISLNQQTTTTQPEQNSPQLKKDYILEKKLMERCCPPPHDRYVGITGKITCTLETKTPLFISNSEDIHVDQEHKQHKTYKFFEIDKKPAVSASALRGMVRNVFEAVTNSCLPIFEYEKPPLSRRLSTDEARNLKPVRVEKINSDGSATLRLLNSAWVRFYDEPDIVPTGNSYSQRTKPTLPAPINFEEEYTVWLKCINHPRRHFPIWYVHQVITDGQMPTITNTNNECIGKGWFYFTNQNADNKHDERFFFYEVDNAGNAVRSAVKAILENNVREKYEILVKEYKDYHASDIEKYKRDGIEPDKKIHGNSPKPAYSKFILEDRYKQLQEGDLVYAKIVENGEKKYADYIVPVSMSRIGYKNTVESCLDDYHRSCKYFNQNAKDITELNLCPACRVFGWVAIEDKQNNDNKSNKNRSLAYASRVIFSNAFIPNPKENPIKILKINNSEEITLNILSSPKPTTTNFYLLQNGQASPSINYDNDNAQLRGRKFYQHHAQIKPQEALRVKKDDQNRSIKNVLDEGNKFTFTINFENLAPVELGALLWSLQLEENWVHRLGYAKPLGFGSVKINVSNLEIIDTKKHCSSLDSDLIKVEKTMWETKCILLFKEVIKSLYAKDNQKFLDLDPLKDMESLLTSSDISVHYPRPPFFGELTGDITKPNPEGKQFEWFIGAKNKKVNESLGIASERKTLSLITRKGDKF